MATRTCTFRAFYGLPAQHPRHVTHLHCPHNIVNREGCKQVDDEPALQITHCNELVVCNNISRNSILCMGQTAGYRCKQGVGK